VSSLEAENSLSVFLKKSSILIEKGLCRSHPSNPLCLSATIKYGFGIYGSAHFSKAKSILH
jgi:hypothetical protein